MLIALGANNKQSRSMVSLNGSRATEITRGKDRTGRSMDALDDYPEQGRGHGMGVLFDDFYKISFHLNIIPVHDVSEIALLQQYP